MERKKFWTFKAAESSPKTGELLLYGPVANETWWGDEVTPKQFRDDLDALGDISDLKVFINSPGGDVFAGQAIYSTLTRHPAKVAVYVDGLAASTASIIAMAGDTIIMPKNAMMMVHNPWTIALGDARAFRKMADELDSIRESMLAAYSAKTGMDRHALIPILNAETWMTAEEAVEKGFADEIEEAKEIAASLLRPGIVAINGQEFDLSRYRNVPAFPKGVRDAPPEEKPTKRAAEKALRDAGFSRDEAKALVAKGWPEERDAPTEPDGMRLFLDYQNTLAAIGAA